MSETTVDRHDVRSLARAAALPLGEERLGPIAEVLNAWLPPTNALSRAMSAPELRATVPVTVFAHPTPAGTE